MQEEFVYYSTNISTQNVKTSAQKVSPIFPLFPGRTTWSTSRTCSHSRALIRPGHSLGGLDPASRTVSAGRSRKSQGHWQGMRQLVVPPTETMGRGKDLDGGAVVHRRRSLRGGGPGREPRAPIESRRHLESPGLTRHTGSRAEKLGRLYKVEELRSLWFMVCGL